MDHETMMQDESDVAYAIRSCFTSPNVADSNWESANVVDSLDRIASAIFTLAKAVRDSNSIETVPKPEGGACDARHTQSGD